MSRDERLAAAEYECAGDGTKWIRCWVPGGYGVSTYLPVDAEAGRIIAACEEAFGWASWDAHGGTYD